MKKNTLTSLIYTTLIATLLLSFAACTPNSRTDSQTQTKTHKEQSSDSSKIKGQKFVVDLVNKAKRQSSSGDHETALVTLERALRIDPKNAAVWHNIAIVKYRMQDYSGAESTAKKSIGYLPQNHSLRSINWELIAASRKARGDISGAEKAKQKSNQ